MSFRSLKGSPALAAVLSFLLPGLGQASAGALRRGALIVLPAVAALVAALLIGVHGFQTGLMQPSFLTAFLAADLVLLAYHAWAIVDAYRVARRVAAPAMVTAATPGEAAIRASAAWSPRSTPATSTGAAAGASLAAASSTEPGSPDAARSVGSVRPSTGVRPAPPASPSRRPRAGWAGATILAVLLVATVGVHGYFALVDVKLQDTLAGLFDPNGPRWLANSSESPDTSGLVPIDTPDPTDSPTPGSTETATATPTPTPTPTPAPVARDWAKDGRLNLLIIGADAGQGRVGLRPDTMILLTVDLKTGRSAMIGVPRNMQNVPLPQPSASAFKCGCFPGMLNALYLEAMTYPKYFPGGDQRGFRAVEGAIGQLTGLKVDGSVLVNLMGFVHLIDALGGLDINVPYKVVDKPGMEPGYQGYVPPEGVGHVSFTIKAGPQHMDGHTALEYARTRAQDWDYARMQRQQLVLLALRKQIAHPCALVPQIPAILDAINQSGGSFWTDMPLDSAPDLLALAERVGAGNAKSITLDPATTGAVCNADKSNCDTLNGAAIANIRYIVSHALDKVPSSSSAAPSGGGGFSC